MKRAYLLILAITVIATHGHIAAMEAAGSWQSAAETSAFTEEEISELARIFLHNPTQEEFNRRRDCDYYKTVQALLGNPEKNIPTLAVIASYDFTTGTFNPESVNPKHRSLITTVSSKRDEHYGRRQRLRDAVDFYEEQAAIDEAQELEEALAAIAILESANTTETIENDGKTEE